MSFKPRVMPEQQADSDDRRERSFLSTRPDDKANTTGTTDDRAKNPGRVSPGRNAQRDSHYFTRSHKFIVRDERLPDSQIRMDSREEIYRFLHAWGGMSHE